jgi:hypothetical protein
MTRFRSDHPDPEDRVTHSLSRDWLNPVSKIVAAVTEA